eukprot:COSAG05_NODE_296_length_11959_cov_17.897639_4_plen_106_part_00
MTLRIHCLSDNIAARSSSSDTQLLLGADRYAYPSWAYTVDYVRKSKVLATFTDYHEHSARSCSKLSQGEGFAPSIVEMNPFRQPRAMPTPLLLLPQCSNAFVPYL